MPVRSVLTGTSGGIDGTTAASTTAVWTFSGSGVLPGDIALVFTEANTGTLTASVTAPTGFSTLVGPSYAAGGVLGGYIFAKTLTAADIATGSITVTWSASVRNLGTVLIVSGGDLSTFQAGTPVLGTTGTSVTPPAVTTTVDGSDVFIAVYAQNTTTTAPTLTSFPAGYTNDSVVRSAIPTTSNFMGAVANLTSPGAAGTVSPGAVTIAGPSHSIGLTVAIASSARPTRPRPVVNRVAILRASTF